MVGWHHRLNGHEFEQTPGMVKDREAWRATVHGVTKSQIWLCSWTTTSSFPQFSISKALKVKIFCKFLENYLVSKHNLTWIDAINVLISVNENMYMFCYRNSMVCWSEPTVGAKSLESLCDPMSHSLPSSPVHGISKARILEWVAISSSIGSSQPRDWICISYVYCIGRQVLTIHWGY